MQDNEFFSVFTTLEFNYEIKELFAGVKVMKITRNQAKGFVNIYIESNRLIHKKHIIDVEKEITKSVFDNADVILKINEKFNLSEEYSVERLFDEYYESLLYEFSITSPTEYSVLRNSETEFTVDGKMKIKVKDLLIIREKSLLVKTKMESILLERFGIETDIIFEFIETEEDDEEYENVISMPMEEKSKPQLKPLRPSKVIEEGKTNLIYGKDFKGRVTSLDEEMEEMQILIIEGQVINPDSIKTKDGRVIMTFIITDFTDSIKAKIFLQEEEFVKLSPLLKEGTFISLKGKAKYDDYEKSIVISPIYGIKTIKDFRDVREDKYPQKRVELHCHTKISEMDGVAETSDLIKRALEWGHNAIAITDHGGLQAFSEAHHEIEDIRRAGNQDFKIIYGVEAYLVDDMDDIIMNSKNQKFSDTYVVFDLETTGLRADKCKIIEIGAVKIQNETIVDTFSTLINPKESISYKIETLTGINNSMVKGAPLIEEMLPKFLDFVGDAVLVAHNANFDVTFINNKAKEQGIKTNFTVADTLTLSRMLIPDMKKFKLDAVAKKLGVILENHHRAVDDSMCTAKIFLKLIDKLKNRNIFTLDGVNELAKENRVELIKKSPTYHGIILAKNETGRINLYTLVSKSNIDYFNGRPRVPKSEILKHREGLILGTACEAGELYQAVYSGANYEKIENIAKFYDYLEIQPNGNNAFLINSGNIKSNEELCEINRKIVDLGERLGKPVVATCDVHFLNPEDEVYRRVIMSGKGFDDADNQAPLFFRTTEEMLQEFSYLGEEKAKEVVITNTNLISDMVEKIAPFRPDKCPPVIKDSDIELRKICYDKAKSLYGENLPEIVVERLERELNSIITNGFAVMYIIAQKLVWKSNEDGYLVGSRGSVGSSFVATMAGITEVNPLKPHYFCEDCKFSDFDSEEVTKYNVGSGCDLPDRNCPVCGRPLNKEGFDIPFETFLGFKGDKEPDIDLNFSGDYQSKAHDYTEVIFGKGQTFRAGTISKLQEKNALGYVRKYFEEKNINKRKCEMERIAKGCIGIKKTTGQHPGGIIVLPHGEDINSFTPIQKPANDMETKIITTQFDYHSIDHNLLKLDILGHDDPTMIRMLEELTGVDAKKITLDNPEVLSLFESTKALGIEPKDIDGCKLGALGLPEFGTDFVIQMLMDTKPKNFSDLVKISGLSHGTNVWLSNAQTLIKEGKATISTAICTRDDIMSYLIGMGLEPSLAFTIMEAVRKGKGLKPDWEVEMKKNNVPDWYIWSCNKIQYMFPKAHAVAYVMMAFRIAYFKVFYPLAYYAAFFSIRATSFDYEKMAMGKEKLNHYYNEYKKKSSDDFLAAKEQEQFKDMKVVQEMYARGFEFEPIDIYRAKATKFQIIDGKLMPAFNTIEGLGEKAAEAIEQSVIGKSFLSKEDFRNKTKISKTVIELMDKLGMLNGMSSTNQISLFDL